MREIVLAHIKKLRWTATWQWRGAANVSWVVKFAPVVHKDILSLLLKEHT